MNKNKYFLVPLIIVMLIHTGILIADETSSTEIAIYGVAVDIKGKAQVGNVETDLDVPFSDIVDNLDFGAMLAIEHRRGNWSLLGDILYMDLSVDDTSANEGPITLEVDAGVEQLIFEGFVTYRFLQEQTDRANYSLDALLGLRYIELDLDVAVDSSFMMGSISRTGNIDEDWLDGVIGLRANYDHSSGLGCDALGRYW